MRRTLPLLLCAALAACGGSSYHRLSKQEYARHADAICTRYRQQAAAVGSASNPAQLAVAARRTLRLLDQTIADLRRLPAPPDERDLVGRWLRSLSRLRGDVIMLRDRAEANDLAGIRRIIGPAQQHDRTSLRLAAKLGMRVCSSNS